MSIELGLDKIKKVLFHLGNPERMLKVIHIAGTNGKGSVGTYINSILIKKGLKVGRYCSPAVFDEYEIIQMNGVNISKEEYDALMEEVEAACFKMNKEPSLFEKQTAVAILYFSKNKCDVCIFEAGMGGSLDATNVFRKNLCSVITNIDYDHKEYLGESIEEITKAKAGIIKNYCRVVLAPQNHASVYSVVKEKADSLYSPLLCVNKNAMSRETDGTLTYRASNGKAYRGIKPTSKALYQLENISTAIEVVGLLNYYEYGILPYDIVDGINNAYWPGRFEKVNDEPVVYIDGAHNPAGIRALKQTISDMFKTEKITLVMGVFADKDYEQMVDIITPVAEKVYTFTPENERGLKGAILASTVERINESVENLETLEKALSKACEDKENIVIVCGSLSYMKQVKGYFSSEDRK